MATQTQAQIDATVTVTGVFAGKGFQTISGGASTAPELKDRPPGTRFSVPVETLPDIENVTVGNTFDWLVDGPLQGGIKAAVGSTGHTVSEIIRDNKLNRIGTITYSPCKLIRYTPPSGDTNSADAKAMHELEFEVGGVV